MVVTECQENESCDKVLNFLERLDDRIETGIGGILEDKAMFSVLLF